MNKINENEILWAKVKPDAKIPTKIRENAGYDIYACFKEKFMVIPLNTTILVPTGLACGMNENYYLQLHERGSVGKESIKISAGVIDSGFRGEIFVALTNCSNRDILISKTDRKGLSEFCINKNKNIKKEEWYFLIAENYKIFPCNKKFTFVYPYEKAICQGIVHRVHNMRSTEINYNKLKKYNSERGEGKLGSSGK